MHPISYWKLIVQLISLCKREKERPKYLHLTCHHDGLGVAVLPEGAGPLARPRGGDQAGVGAAGRQRGPAHSEAATPTPPHRVLAAVVGLHGVVLRQAGGQGHGLCHEVVLSVFTCHVSSQM